MVEELTDIKSKIEYIPPVHSFVAELDRNEMITARMVAAVMNSDQQGMVSLAPQVESQTGDRISTRIEFHHKDKEAPGEEEDIFTLLFNTLEAFDRKSDIMPGLERNDILMKLLNTKLKLYRENISKAALKKDQMDWERNSLAITTTYEEDGTDFAVYIDTHLDTKATVKLADKAANRVFVEYVCNPQFVVAPNDLDKLNKFLKSDISELMINSIEESEKQDKNPAEISINFAQVKGPNNTNMLEVSVFDKGGGFPQEIIDKINNNQTDTPSASIKPMESARDNETRSNGLNRVARDIRRELQGSIRIGNMKDGGSFVGILIPLSEPSIDSPRN